MKINILGAAGTGVTTLGLALSKQTGYNYFDSDTYFWLDTDLPFTQKRVAAVRNSALLTDLKQQDNWILGGSVINWGRELSAQFDLIIFLYLPREIRMKRLENRELERYGELINTDAERQQQYKNFMAWAGDYDQHTGIANRTLKAHENWLKASSCPTIKLIGDLTNESRMAVVVSAINNR